MTAPAPDSHPQPRILLAEDDARLAGAYARRLEAECLEVDVVGSVAAAREHERRGGYACLLLDRLLPDGDVLVLVHEINGRVARPPIILVSAVADEEDRVEGLRAGADDYVAKPVRLDELAIRVTRLVGIGGGARGRVLHPGQRRRGGVRPGAVPRQRRRRAAAPARPAAAAPPPADGQRRPARHHRRLLDACAAGATAEVSLAAHLEALGQALDGALTIEGSTARGYTVRPGAHRRRRLIRRAPRRPS